MADLSEKIASLSPQKLALLRRKLLEKGSARPAERIGRRRPSAWAPLSFAQERLWIIDQLEPGSTAYHVPLAVRLAGELDAVALHWSLAEIVRRHEALRTHFATRDGSPVQVISPFVPPVSSALPRVDLTALAADPADPAGPRESEVRRLLDADVLYPFDLGRGPLFRATLVVLGKTEHLLLTTLHHIVSDGWSGGVLLAELAALYAARQARREGHRSVLAVLPELPVQYADYAVWQRSWLSGEVLEREIAYWRETLAGVPVLELPADRPRHGERSGTSGTCPLVVSPGLTAELAQLGRGRGATLFMVLLAAFDVLLYRHTGEEDVAVGSAVANRTRPEIEGLVGFFVNTLVLRTPLSAETGAMALLARVREMTLAAYSHQDVPFEKLVAELRPERGAYRSPFFQVFLTLQNTPVPERRLPGLTLTQLPTPGAGSKFELSLSLASSGEVGDGGLAGGADYARELFDPTTVDRLMRQLVHLLAAFVAAPERTVGDLPLLGAAERHQLLAEWNDTRRAPPWPATVHRRFAEQAARRPEAVALAGAGGEQITYGELDRRAARLARRLLGLGLPPEAPVGVFAERSPAMVTALLAVLQAGGAYLPLDPAYPDERLGFMLRDSRTPVVLTGAALAGRLSGQGVIELRIDAAGEAGNPETTEPDLSVDADGLAYVMYTSGSTGRPKGVAVPHRGVVRLARDIGDAGDTGLGPGEVFLQFAPISFDASTFEIWGDLLHGARLVLAPEGALALADLGEQIERHGVTTLWLTAGLFHLMVDHQLDRLRPVRRLLAGGDVLSPRQVERALRALPGTRLVNGYGPTENTTFTCCHPMALPDDVGRSVALGRPIAETRVHILDRGGRPVPVGASGELCTGGEGLARGYLNRPDLTAERFVPDPFAVLEGAGGRLYRTGDLARYRPDGRLDFLGRIDHQVKLRGFRIEPGEIEARLREHPGVLAAAVALHEQPVGNLFLVAYLVGDEVSDAALRDHLRAQLPEYMVPTAFVRLEALPLTPNGKVDRRRLPALTEGGEIGRAPGAALSFPSLSSPSSIAEILAGIWRDLLRVEEVHLADSFFDLGGYSLVATRLSTRVREAFGIEISLHRLFADPTLAGLVAEVEQGLRQDRGAEPPPLVPVDRSGPLPLSFAQQRLWIVHQVEPGLTAYHVPLALRLAGELDAAALHGSLGEILYRHEALRTRFATEDSSPFQVILPFVSSVSAALPRVDLTGLSAEWREGELQRLLQVEAFRPFDLERGPLFRATLVALDATDHALLTTMHHIVSDGWSVGVLLAELAALYGARFEGRPSGLAGLPELPVQYADYAVWQRRWLSGEVLEREVAYWRETLAGAPVLELPADRPRHGERSRISGTRSYLVLPADRTAELARLGRLQGVTLFMVLLAAFDALLYRYTGETDVAVGSPIANRTRREIEGLVGFFVNTLVLRTAVSPAAGAVELLKRVRETTLAAYSHQDVPFEKLVEELQPERGAHRSPFFLVLLALQNAPLPVRQLPGLTLTPLPSPGVGSKFELSLSLAEAEDGGLLGGVEYGRELFDPSTLDRLVGHFTHLLAAFAAGPERAVGALPLFGDAERHQLLAEWNDTRRELPAPALVHRWFAEQAARRPEAVALLSAAGERITYAELERRADRLARRLLRRGLRPDVPVGVFLPRSPEMMTAFLAILKAGGAYVPLDPAYPADRLDFMLRDTAAPLVLTREALADRLSGQGAAVVCLDREADDPVAEIEAPGFPPAVDAAHLAYILYTSGSTGRPKGVAVSHRAVARLVRETDYARFGPDEVFLQFAPVAFDASTFEIWGALLNGGQVVLAPEGAVALSDLGDLIDRHGITTVFLTTALFHLMVDHQLARLRPLRQLLTGGEMMSPTHVRRALAGLPETRLTIFYGPTENTTFTTYCPLADPVEVGAAVPLGRPIANTRAYVLDGQGELAPLGAVGELCAAGEGLARGYLNRPERTAERFVPDPHGVGGRLYRTGDLARVLPDGRLDFLGRIDHQVKLRGYRIEPGEIEARLLDHPAVREAVVVVHEQPVGNRFLVAYVVGDEVSEAVLRDSLREQLPEYMVPTAFVSLPELPLTPNGKVDRRRLPAPSAERPAGEGVVEADSEVLPAFSDSPLVPVAELLTELWRDLLRVDKVELGDDFFALGGYSLIATGLSLRVREAFGVEISLQRLFDDPTLAGLVAEVEQGLRGDRGVEPPLLLPVDRGGFLPLSFAQERLWILDRLEPGSTAYHVPLALRLVGELDAVALHRSLGEIVRRHEALRTRFAVVDGNPVQVILPFAPPVPPALPRVDLTALSAERREAELRRRLVADALRPFDLEQGPLFRTTLVLLGVSEHALLTNMHHIVSDGWSIGVLLGELTALYGAGLAGRPSALPELPVQYADFAVWQRLWLAGEVLEREIAYWRRALHGVPVLELPADRPRPWERSGPAGTRSISLPAALLAELAQLGRRRGVTLFMVLLAAFKVLLKRYTGAADFAVGSPIANRTRREIEGLVGFFVNTLVLRTVFAADTGAGELLKRVRETTLGAYAHQDVPFEKLVEDLQPERGAHRTPFFQVAFALQNAPLPARRLPGLALTLLLIPSLGAKFELSLGMAEAEDGRLEGAVEYGRELFDRTTIDRLLGHFAHLLAALVATPERAVGELPLLSPAERRQLLGAWSGAEVEPGPDRRLYDLVAEQVARRAEAVAVLCGGESLSYGELDRRAARLARRLRGLGVGPEVRVGLLCEPSIERLVGLLGVLRSGGAYVPLDPEHPPARLAAIVDSSGMAVALAQDSLRAKLVFPAGMAGAAGAVGALPVLSLAEPWVEADPAPAGEPATGLLPANLAYVIYTSGSTGRPNGVLVPQRGVAELIAGVRERFGIGPGSRLAQAGAFTFDLSVMEIFLALGSGATLVVAPSGERLGEALAALLIREAVTMLATTPALLATLAPEGLALSSVTVGGDRCPAALVRRWAPRVALYNCYGPTETSVFSVYGRLEGEGGEPAIGRPVAGTEVYLLGRDLEPVPPGAAGELSVGGAGVARGYAGQPAKTAERFVPHPFPPAPGERLYRTGDLARFRSDGRLEFLGRNDSQIKIRGVRIEPGEIETVLAGHGEVRQAAVVARDDLPGGRGLVGFVVAREGSPLTASSLRQHAAAHLPATMVPARLVALDRLPTTVQGKVDRRALAGWPLDEGVEPASTAPRTPLEELLASLFADLLGRQRVGIDDGFFALGGHSLLATRLLSRLREVSGVELPMRELFEAPTVAGLAERIHRAKENAAGTFPPPVEPVRREGVLPLSYAQQRLWILHQLEPGSTAYHVPLALRLTGDLDAAALCFCLGEIVHRHEALRTRFAARDGSPVQVITPFAPPALPLIDLAALAGPAGRRETELRRLIHAESLRPFHLEQGPLFRATLVALDVSPPAEHALLTNMHHIVSDGWSVGVLLGELAALYGARLDGRPDPLPELPVQYADYAVWQRRWLQGEVLEREIAYWRQALAGLPVLELPVDRPRHWERSGSADTRPLAVSPALAAELAQLGRRQGVTLFMLLLATLAALLHRYAGRGGQDDVAVGSAVANRTRREIEGLVGFFVNTLVLRATCAAATSTGELLKQVRETTLAAYAHQDVPFEKLVEELQPERGPHRSPFFQVFLLLQNTPLPEKRLPGLTLTPLPIPSLGAKFDLTLSLAEAEDGTLQGGIEYGRELFDPATVERLAGHFTRLLAGFAAAPERAIGELPLLGAAERHQLLAEWNDTRRTLPRPAVVHPLFAEQAALRPEAVALISAAGERISYGELDRRADRLARRLLRRFRRGLPPESPVGVFLERSPETVTAFLAVLKAGGAYVPIDPSYPVERVEHMLRDSRAPIVVTQAALAERLAGLETAVVEMDREEDDEEDTGVTASVAVEASNLAYVIYTSGSTGLPKGVCVAHEGIVRLVREGGFATLGPDDVVLHTCPVSFDVATFEIWGALLSGSTLSILPSATPSLDELGEAIARDQVTTLWLTSGLFTLMVNHRLLALSPVRQLLAGGDVVPLAQAQRVLAELPGCRLIDGYGPTENTTFTACHPIGQGLSGRSSVPIGRPIGNTTVAILDVGLQPVPFGVAGELYTGGLGLARGYFDQPERTAERFLPDAVSGLAGERLYRTGDRARWLADGTIEFLGRVDHQVKVRGY
ncbi:MAG TPA: amino acid adenylation domain-containing protein, partial [Thermoanaerobaculia bacterium]|nr:amino acid adenylation domain-containing protein [Thermoanaerobaculia bacterium]